MSPEIITLLAEARKFVRPTVERTLFSLGGRGHYENPASDLLAFFLKPDGEHGFGAFFLHTFLNCMEVSYKSLSFDDVEVTREEWTSERKRIDLLIKGRDWVLLIENKIFSGQNNPFDVYKKRGTELNDENPPLMAVLSPEGEAPAGWTGVSYRNYCAKLREGLSCVILNRAYSKWFIFVREFILHLETELYQPSVMMTEQEANFVEDNEAAIKEIKRLSEEYRSFLLNSIEKQLNDTLLGHPFKCRGQVWGNQVWAVRCESQQWGDRADLAFFSAEQSVGGGRFQVRLYLYSLSKELRHEAQTELKGMQSRPREGATESWQTGFDTRSEAIHELGRLAQIVGGIFSTRSETEPAL
jgi:hypothetical protein